MAVPLLTTQLYVPPVPPELVSRPRLIERLNNGLHRKLTLVSAPAGFGKTRLLNEGVVGTKRPLSCLSTTCLIGIAAANWLHSSPIARPLPPRHERRPLSSVSCLSGRPCQ